MKHQQYQPVLVSSDKLQFSFTSVGPKGAIKKVICFSQTENPDIFNMTLGNLTEHGAVDYNTTIDNKDRNAILTTAKESVYAFTSHYPDKSVFYKGNTIEKTRLYRMALTRYFDELKNDFEIFGVLGQGIGFFAENFVAGKEYFGFLLKRKNIFHCSTS